MPELRVRPESVDTVEIRVTVTVYVEIVVPSWAVTNMVIGLEPTASGIEALAAPEAVVLPFTLTVAVASVTIGVTVIVEVALATLAVYVLVADAKLGLSVPEFTASPESVATADAARVTDTV